MDLKQRFTCALVCCDWAKAAAAAASDSIVKHGLRDLTQLQRWLDKHGSHLKVLQLFECTPNLARLPCAQLQDLLLHGANRGHKLFLSSRLWSNIAAATKLTSVSLDDVRTSAQQADVVSALAALPDLQQLTWREVVCGGERELSDSRLLQQLTRLTSLHLQYVAAEVLQRLSSLTKLQHLSTHSPSTWVEAGCSGLEGLQGITSLLLQDHKDRAWDVGVQRFPACVSHLTALQQLEVLCATVPELNGLTALTALTKLQVTNFYSSSTPLQLPALQHLILRGKMNGGSFPPVHTSTIVSCTQLRCLSLQRFALTGPGNLVGSSMLQELVVGSCSLSSGEDGPAAMSSWELLFPGAGRLPHLTSLVLRCVWPEPRQADVERLVACCSGLRVLHLECEQLAPQAMPGLSAVASLPHLTKLHLSTLADEQCSSLAQLTVCPRWLTGLRELQVLDANNLSAAGLRHLASLQQLTSLGFCWGFDADNISPVIQEQLSDTVRGCRHAIVNKVREICSAMHVVVGCLSVGWCLQSKGGI